MTIMQQLLTHATRAAARGEVPVAACIVAGDGAVLAIAHNEVELRADATAHAELLAIHAACAARGSKYLEDCTLYVTLEPCALCAAASSLAKLRKVVFGAYDPKSGGVEHGARVFAQPTCHHAPEVVGGVLQAECAALLTEFFRERR